jgi:hypothetical protein
MFEIGRQWTADMSRWGQVHTVANPENFTWLKNAVGRTDIILFMPCEWTWIWAFAPCMQSNRILDIIRLFAMGPTSIDRYIRSIVCYCHWNSCSGTVLRVIHVRSGLRQEVRHSVTMGNWQAYSRDTPLHPSWRNSSHKHPLVKWCWLCSLTSRDPCFWTLYHVTAQSLQSLQRMFPNIRNKYLEDWIILLHNNVHPDGPLDTIQLEVPKHSAYILAYHCSFHVFELLKKTLKDHTFTWNDDMQEAVVEAAG